MAGIHINAGELNQRIQIYQLDRTKVEGNYEETKKKLVLGCWAKVTRVSGTEMVKANADFGEEKVRFLIRCPKKEIDRKMVVQFKGREYEIQYTNDYGGRTYLEIWCVWKSREAK